MESNNIHQHISRQYDHELLDIRNQVLALGGLVEEQVKSAIQALMSGDMEIAERVIADDYKVNSMEVTLDEACTQIIALRQPAARDLRLIVAVIKTITDLERIGDEAKRIGRIALDLASHQPRRNQLTDLEHLAQHVRKLLREALDAFGRQAGRQGVRKHHAPATDFHDGGSPVHSGVTRYHVVGPLARTHR
jgi:phosphate transport system protein